MFGFGNLADRTLADLLSLCRVTLCPEWPPKTEAWKDWKSLSFKVVKFPMTILFLYMRMPACTEYLG
jgi:hypothetical protein